MDITQRHIEHLGTTLHYTVQGTGQAVILLPSLGRGPADFDELAALLAGRGFKAIRPWPRGLAPSHGPAAATLHDYATDMATLIRREGMPDAILAGHAFGNFVARCTAADHPELVRGVVLIAGSPGKTADGAQSIPADVLESVYASGNPELSDEARIDHLKKAFFAPGNDPSVWLAGWYPELKASQTVAWHATPVDEFFAAGSAPILDLQAALDTVAPRWNASLLKNSLGERVTVKVIEGAGHALVPEEPERVAQAIATWAAGLRFSPYPSSAPPAQNAADNSALK